MPWTEKQEQVITERDKTILVSAAAGSGKTATLVERIYQKMIDPEHPVDITSFLVVTFTKAAAAQMKEKLLKKLEEAQEQYPESEHIAKQNMLIQSADITTIDSFCLNIVKEYFSYLNLDPAVGIGDPGMLEMLKYDVMTALFEEKYAQLQEQGDTEFGRLLEVFCDGKRDENLKDVLDKIYRQITSFPAPERFLEEARMGLQIDTAEDLNHAPWMQAMLDILHKKAAAAVQLAERCLAICEEADGPEQYREQGRNGMGIKAMNLTDKTGRLAAQLLVYEEEDILLITADGTIIRTPVGAIPVTGRNTQGVRLMRVDGSRIVCVAPSDAEDEDEGEALPDEANPGAGDAVSDERSGEAPETNGEPDSLDRLVDDLEANPEPPAGDDDI